MKRTTFEKNRLKNENLSKFFGKSERVLIISEENNGQNLKTKTGHLILYWGNLENILAK